MPPPALTTTGVPPKAAPVAPVAPASASPPFDLGEWICRPLVPLIPRSVHPNHITFTNHAFNWILMTLAFMSSTVERTTAIQLLLACAVVNFCCLVLDCLDGMHARATRQTSKLGEVLDHWLDAFHVPLVGSGICYALQIAPASLVWVHIANAMLYCSQLIYYYYARVFIGTAGVEAQLTASGLYLLAAALIWTDPNGVYLAGTIAGDGWWAHGGAFGWRLHWFARNFVPVFTLGVDLYLTRVFVKHYDWQMWRAFANTIIINLGFAFVYLCGGMGMREFCLCLSLVSLRVTGSYVLFTILKKPFPGIDRSLYVWIAVLFFGLYALAPVVVTIPPSVFGALPSVVTSLIHAVGGVDGGAAGSIVIQRLLPSLCIVHTAVRNVHSLAVNYDTIKRINSKR